MKIYWTSIFASASLGAWLLYLLWSWNRVTPNEKLLIIAFILNIFLIILVREKSY